MDHKMLRIYKFMTFPTPELCTAKAETKTVLDVSVTVHYKIILLGLTLLSLKHEPRCK